MFPPFIYSDSEQQIKRRPDWYDEDHAALVRNFEVEKTEEQNTGNPEPGELDAEQEAEKFPVSQEDEKRFMKIVEKVISPRPSEDDNL